MTKTVFLLVFVFTIGVITGWQLSNMLVNQSANKLDNSLVESSTGKDSTEDFKADVNNEKHVVGQSEDGELTDIAAEDLSLIAQTESTRQLVNSELVNLNFDNHSSYLSAVLASNASTDDKLDAIEGLQSQAAVDEITHAFGDENADVRLKAIDALAQVGDEKSVRYIGQLVIGDIDVNVRLKALEALSLLTYDSNAFVFIEYAANNDTSEQVKAYGLSLLN